MARLGLAKPSVNASNVIHYCSMTTCQINENVIYPICQVSMADLIKSLVLTETKPAPQMLSTIKTESRLNVFQNLPTLTLLISRSVHKF